MKNSQNTPLLEWALKHTRVLKGLTVWDLFDDVEYFKEDPDRIWVHLPQIGYELLDRSPLFKRGRNFFFHPGYPISYREKAHPSIQISVSEDLQRAEIDIDFRKSWFPACLFNGHLTKSNSLIAKNMKAYHERWFKWLK